MSFGKFIIIIFCFIVALLQAGYSNCALIQEHVFWHLAEHKVDIEDIEVELIDKTLDELGTIYVEGNVVDLSKKDLVSIEGIENFTVIDVQTQAPILLKDINDLALILKGNKIKSLPAGLFTLTNLTTLDLSHIDIDILPEALGNLLHLRELNLTGNYLKELPHTIGFLQKLKTLNLAYNSYLLRLPESCKDLFTLEELDITCCTLLVALPFIIHNLKKFSGSLLPLESDINTLKRSSEFSESESALPVKTIDDIPSDRRSILPLSIDSLTYGAELSHINLSGLGLTDITSIDQLQVNYNNQPVSLASIPNLSLDLSDNYLTILSEDICKLQLRWLIVRSNKLEKLPDSLNALGTLNYLCLTHNKLRLLPLALAKMIGLEYLYLGDNLLNQFVMPPNLKILVLSNNDLISFITPQTRFPDSLRWLWLNNNRLNCDAFVGEKLSPDSLFRCAGHLFVLALHDNLILSLPIVEPSYTHLRAITLNRNQITQLPDYFFKSIKSLSYLDLSNNPLESLPISLKEVKYLKVFRLVGCRQLPLVPLVEDGADSTKIEKIAYLESVENDTAKEKRKDISKFLTDLHQKNCLIFFDLWKALQTKENIQHSLKVKIPQDIGDMINQYL